MQSKKIEKENLLIENPDRFVLFPIKYPKLWKMYENHKASFWIAQEIGLQTDVKNWDTLDKNKQHFIKYVLAFFAASDGIVSENIALRFYKEIQIPEVRCFYGFQLMMENIHSETYSILLDTYIKDVNEKNKLFRAIETIPTIAKKAKWAIKWIGSEDQKSEEQPTFAERLIAFAVVEGIFFSGSFCAIFWLKQFGKLPGLSQSNQLISRDEGLHTDFACLLYTDHIVNKLPESRVQEIIREGVEIEKEFVVDAIPVEMVGMKAEEMCKYIEYVADRLLKQLGCDPIFNTLNPFIWMEQISLQGNTNFFEAKVTEYKKTTIIDLNNDFNKENDSDYF